MTQTGCTIENHADAALLAIQAISNVGLTPVEKIAVLTTASQLMKNHVEAAATTMALNPARRQATNLATVKPNSRKSRSASTGLTP